MVNRVVLLFVLSAGFACKADKPETLVESGYDQAEMDAAIERARTEVDRFVSALEKNEGSDFAVKAPISGGGQTEHFWLTDVSYADGQFTGKVGNDPGIVKTVEIGQPWTIAKTEISDWMYMKGGKMYGNYTMRPLLATMPEEQAEQYRSMLAEP